MCVFRVFLHYPEFIISTYSRSVITGIFSTWLLGSWWWGLISTNQWGGNEHLIKFHSWFYYVVNFASSDWLMGPQNRLRPFPKSGYFATRFRDIGDFWGIPGKSTIELSPLSPSVWMKCYVTPHIRTFVMYVLLASIIGSWNEQDYDLVWAVEKIWVPMYFWKHTHVAPFGASDVFDVRGPSGRPFGPKANVKK